VGKVTESSPVKPNRISVSRCWETRSICFAKEFFMHLVQSASPVEQSWGAAL